MKILSLYLHVIPNTVNNKDTYIFFFTMKFIGVQCSLDPNILQIPSFVFYRRKEVIVISNYMRVSKVWQNFHIWVNSPFKWVKRHKAKEKYKTMVSFYKNCTQNEQQFFLMLKYNEMIMKPPLTETAILFISVLLCFLQVWILERCM